MMTRRDALKTTIAGLLGAYIAPAPRPAIDLMAFCARRPGVEWDMRLPYHLDDWTYATDAAVCVRVGPAGADRAERAGEVPPVEKLSWNHGDIRGWRTLPDVPALLARDTPCPTCDGYGCMGTPLECERCGGIGKDYSGDWPGSWPDCKACAGVGHTGGGPTCPTCKGVKPVGVRPGIVRLDDVYFDAALYAKVRRLGGEFVMDRWHALPEFPLLKFRFHGGDGLLMGLNRASAERRILEAPCG